MAKYSTNLSDGDATTRAGSAPTTADDLPTVGADLVAERKRPRACMYVDGENLIGGCEHYRDTVWSDFRYDVNRIRSVLANGYELIEAHWFDSLANSRDTDDFFGYLEHHDWELTLGGARNDGTPRGSDVSLATELLADCFDDRYDVAILVSGDGDYEPAIRKIRSLDKAVVVASFDGVASAVTTQLADRYIKLDRITPLIRRDN